MKLFCFGFGYSAAALATRLHGRADVAIAGTRTRATTDTTDGIPIAAYQSDARSPAVIDLLTGATHVLISIPPDIEGCAALRHFGDDLAALPSLVWVGYLSTIGVYGDHKGAWIDEDTPVKPASERSLRRWQAEQGWRSFGQASRKSVQVFRLPGIYGPGRSVLDNLRAGTAKRMIKPGQVFNRIHVDDIAQALDVAMLRPTQHDLFNITDDEPCPPEDVVAYGAELLGLPPPPETAFEGARLSPMAASFYAENKRVRNSRLKQSLGVSLIYPTYREGLLGILRAR